VKLPLYAAGGFAEVWLVDVNSRSVFVHREPRGDAWSQVFVVEGEGTVSPLAFPDVAIRVAELWPPTK
jgi:Uma2 family endonuclease